MRKKLSIAIAVMLSLFIVGAIAQSSTSKKIVSVNFKSTGSYTWPTTADYPSALSMDMTFNSGAYSNTFYFGYVRAGVQHDMLSYTADGTHSLVWYIPSRYFFQTGDKLVWSNSVAQNAVFTLNTDAQY